MIMMILVYLLSIVLTSAVASIYDYPLISVMTPFIMLVCALAVAMCYLAEKRRLIGGVVIVVTYVITIYIIQTLSSIGSYSSDMYFWQWVLNRADDTAVVVPYILALLIGSAMFLTAVTYYFAIVLYRVSFLTLVSLLPCVLYVKVTADIDNVYLIMIATLNCLIHLQHYRCVHIRHIGRRTSMITALIFTMSILLVASVIPKEEEAYYYDRFEEMFLNGDTTSELDGSYGSINEYSGNADNYKQTINRRMYRLSGDVGEYVKRQTFDAYDYDLNRWYSLEDDSSTVYTSDEWSSYAIELTPEKLQQAIKQACEYDSEFEEQYGLSELVKTNSIITSKKSMYVQALNFSARYYLTPVYGYAVKNFDSSEYTVTANGVFYRRLGSHDANAAYQVDYYSQLEGYTIWAKLGAANFDNDTAYAMLLDLEQILEDNNDSLVSVAKAYVSQMDYVYAYRELTSDNTAKISATIYDIASRVTKDCNSDYEKAQALCDYFENDDFIYDLEYKSSDDSPEYFLTVSKTGTCSDFASAYVLMARAVGLTVRYVEGYVPEEDNTISGVYYISDSSSHAYAEVYIQNTGWFVFDPTVAGDESESRLSLLDILKNLRMDYGLIGVIIVFIVVLAIIGIFIGCLIPIVRHKTFLAKAYFSHTDECALMLYRRLVKGREYLTPGEVADICAAKGCDISYLILYIERVLYRGYAGDGERDARENRKMIKLYSKARRV